MERGRSPLAGVLMSGTETRTRLALLDELAQIVGAMKNLAYAELQRLNRLLEAQQTSENVLFQSLQDLWPESLYTHSSKASTDLWLALGSERGFCGGFFDQPPRKGLSRPEDLPETPWLSMGARLLPHPHTPPLLSQNEYHPPHNRTRSFPGHG